ncbi:hypothetical protein F2Q68_00008316 [Brassica cretica]|uniref:SWIM-type domain-containing protein n=1 Tax=Brassica cretica TaxID=69181 RepID=A0A8S9L2L0_BRACR|nr:hypothetical protein F2Q68_00008316 [Brassica cretica]
MVRHINKSEYEVRGRDGVPYSVDLDKKSCSCLEFDMLLIPCTHAVAAAVHSRKRSDTLGVMHLAPPNTRRPPGRPKKTRILSRGEFKEKGQGLVEGAVGKTTIVPPAKHPYEMVNVRKGA